jgi:Sigma-70 region 2
MALGRGFGHTLTLARSSPLPRHRSGHPALTQKPQLFRRDGGDTGEELFAPFPNIPLWPYSVSQNPAAKRYKGVQVMNMANRWAEAEFEAIFRGHYERIVRMTRSVLRSDVEAEEVCAEVFLRLYRSGPAVLDGGMVGGWLYCAATRAAIDILRRNKRRGAEEKIDSVHSAVTEDGSDDPLNRLLRGERIAEVRSILGTGN